MAAVAQPVIPAWVVPDENAVRDLLNIAPVHGEHDPHAAGCADAAQWVTGWPDITDNDAGQRMTEALTERSDRHQAGIADVLGWLLGVAGPPIELPGRNPDGTLITARQLYERWQREAPLPWAPEQRREHRDRADTTARRWARLAELG